MTTPLLPSLRVGELRAASVPATPGGAAAPPPAPDRVALVRRGRQLARLTIGWNAVEGLVGIAAGVAAGSVALVGFGVDSYVEVLSGCVILWRLAAEDRGQKVSEAAEHRAVRVIAVTFLLLAAGVAVESVARLAAGARPDISPAGLVLALVSLVVMPILARAKRRIGEQLGSRALRADAAETSLCVWLSAIVLGGLALNAAFGWWWADPVAAFGIVYLAAREGLEHWRAETVNDCC